MLLAQKALRNGLKAKVESVAASEEASEEVKAACKEWLDTFNCGATNGTDLRWRRLGLRYRIRWC